MDKFEQNKLSSQNESEVKSAAEVSVPSEVDGTSEKVPSLTKTMEDILKELVEKGKLDGEHEMIISSADAFNVEIDTDNPDVDVESPSDSLKLCASFFHWYDAAAYEYVRQNYNTPLPDIKVLGRWCENKKFQPGFTKQAFDILQKKSAESGKRITCTLVADDYQLFSHACYASVDVGGGGLENDYGWEMEGRMAFVILLVGLEETWKIPVGYFMGNYTYEHSEANIIKMALHRCHEIGVDVVSVVVSKDIARFLGCNFTQSDTQSAFNHPATGNPVATFLRHIPGLFSPIDPKSVYSIALKAMSGFLGAIYKQDRRQMAGKFQKLYKKHFNDLAGKIAKQNKRKNSGGRTAAGKQSSATSNKRRKT